MMDRDELLWIIRHFSPVTFFSARRNDNVIMTSKRRRDVVLTS